MTSYSVMRQDIETGRMVTASRPYVQRAAAFKRAAWIAKVWPEGKVTVWEYTGPGESTVHVVHEPASVA